MKTFYAACIMVAGFSVAHAQNYYGKFEGELILKPLSGNSGMRLEKDYWFIDSAGGRWDAPAGTVSDGASIPKFLWSFVGDPWGADYRNAAVIHDVACKEKKRPWEAVHLNFYHAMLAAGVTPRGAKIMYTAVYHFGPKWGTRTFASMVPRVDSNGKVIYQRHAIAVPFNISTKNLDKDDYKKIEERVNLLEKQNIDEDAQLAVLRREEVVEVGYNQ